MLFSALARLHQSWARRHAHSLRQRRLHGNQRPRWDCYRLSVEALEDRVVPAAPVHDLTTHLDYSTIQAAVNAANPGDVIQVDAGTYPESVTINKALTLDGANAGVHPAVGT